MRISRSHLKMGTDWPVNILLRISRRDDPQYKLIGTALKELNR